MFDVDRFKSLLDTRWLGKDLIYVEQLNSTSTHLRRKAVDEVQHGTLCLTDYQTRGRGQHGRDWMTEAGANLTFTLAFKPPEAKRLHVLTLACALATANFIEASMRRRAELKWPNDVIVDDRKLAGFLTETVFTGSHLDRIIVGIGLNVNQTTFPNALCGQATSMALLDGRPDHQREEVLAKLLKRIEQRYQEWAENDVDMLRDINRKLVGYGQWVTLNIDGRIIEERCKFLGINAKGELVVLWQNDEVETFSYEQIRIITD